ncbi:hypothetical protein UNDYM_2637 [Undibacterium sp. YM2]|nr:hypothetical protein UNDYM_2637 [Undibacterium sp. YM2]
MDVELKSFKAAADETPGLSDARSTEISVSDINVCDQPIVSESFFAGCIDVQKNPLIVLT